MKGKSTIVLTIEFIDPQLDAEERDQRVMNFIRELKEVDEVDKVSRVIDPNPPAGNKSFTSFLVGLLTAELSFENAEKVFNILKDRLRNKPIKLKIETSEKSLEVEVNNIEELNLAIDAAKKFID